MPDEELDGLERGEADELVIADLAQPVEFAHHGLPANLRERVVDRVVVLEDGAGAPAAVAAQLANRYGGEVG